MCIVEVAGLWPKATAVITASADPVAPGLCAAVPFPVASPANRQVGLGLKLRLTANGRLRDFSESFHDAPDFNSSCLDSASIIDHIVGLPS